MAVELDPVIQVGAVTVAALARRGVERGPSRAATFLGAKRPVAVLVRRDGVTLAFDENGARIALDDLERRFPGRCGEFERLSQGEAPA